jgi:hypothetical protein
MTGVGVFAADGGMATVPAMLAHQIALSRGAAFTGNAANAIGRRLMGAGAVFQKWMPLFQNAARAGNVGVVSLHHQLMNNDPEYKAAVLSQEEP